MCCKNRADTTSDFTVNVTIQFLTSCGPGNVVGMVTGYVLDGPGIEFRWGRDFLHLSRPALGPTQPPVQWVPAFSPGVKSGRGVMLTPHPLLVLWSRKGRAIPLLPLWAVWPVQGCTFYLMSCMPIIECEAQNTEHQV